MLEVGYHRNGCIGTRTLYTHKFKKENTEQDATVTQLRLLTTMPDSRIHLLNFHKNAA